MTTPKTKIHRQSILRRNLATALEGSDIASEATPQASLGQQRRRRGIGKTSQRTMQFIEHDDGLIEIAESSADKKPELGGRRRGITRPRGQLVEEVPFNKLKTNQVTQAIQALDKTLSAKTLDFGMYRCVAQRETFKPIASIDKVTLNKKRVLVLVHGTFSSSDVLLKEIRSTPEGKQLYADALKHYDAVLAFNHPTLAVSPLLNARDLAAFFGNVSCEVDVIAHSRGGLVVRSWLESMNHANFTQTRALLAGSPLAGTSLASPPNLKSYLSLIASIGNGLGAAAAAVPFLGAVAGLTKIFSSVTSLVAKTPALDAAVALVPGLQAQSRVGNNQLILSMREHQFGTPVDYFFVKSNFEPKGERWKFWKNLRGRAVNAIIDPIFKDDNDLVVDTRSMTELAASGQPVPADIFDFGTQGTVHHCNYFSQEQTIDFIALKFGI